MSYTPEEAANLRVVTEALENATHDFTKFFDAIFASDVEWTIAGHGAHAQNRKVLSNLTNF
jgi:hypothetical protein